MGMHKWTVPQYMRFAIEHGLEQSAVVDAMELLGCSAEEAEQALYEIEAEAETPALPIQEQPEPAPLMVINSKGDGSFETKILNAIYEWTPVSTDLPDGPTTVIVGWDESEDNPPVWLGYHHDDVWFDVATGDRFEPQPTHWMERPSRPAPLLPSCSSLNPVHPV